MGAEQTPGIQGDTDYRSLAAEEGESAEAAEKGGARTQTLVLAQPGNVDALGLVIKCVRIGRWKACLECGWLYCRIVITLMVLNASPGEGFCATETGCRERSAARFQREERHMIWSRELVKQGTRKAAYVLAATVAGVFANPQQALAAVVQA